MINVDKRKILSIKNALCNPIMIRDLQELKELLPPKIKFTGPGVWIRTLKALDTEGSNEHDTGNFSFRNSQGNQSRNPGI